MAFLIRSCNQLARLTLTGGGLQNIALNAAFLAAAEKTPVAICQDLFSQRRDAFIEDTPGAERRISDKGP
jgi:hypothetical protein